jgi:transposase
MENKLRTSDVREWRRRRAWELQQQGWLQKDIATALGVSKGAVSQWLKRGREGGLAALQAQPRPGARPKLRAEQWTQVPGLLARGAEAFGFRGDVWTCHRIAALIEQTFGVRYHPEHVRRLLRKAGWSVQQPIERATQRQEHAIEQWWEERWPALQKKRALRDIPSSG